VFAVEGIDHLRFMVGNAKQAAHYHSTAFGMSLVAYRGPETGSRDYAEYVLGSGSVRFVVAGAVRAGTFGGEHRARHGDGITDIALEVPDVEKAYAHAFGLGAVGLERPQEVIDEHGAVVRAAIAAYGETRHSLIDRSRYAGVFLPGFVARDPVVDRTPAVEAGLQPRRFSRWSTTWSATSIWARWTSGCGSTSG
jgi:4-hydroxyphenylpyruvate dioxygenase